MAKHKGAKGGEAEKIVQAWLELGGWRTHRAAKAGFTKFKRADGTDGAFNTSNDFFGCFDLLAIMPEEVPETWALQVTTQNGRALRRTKLEAHPWPFSWRVSLVSHEAIPDPANRARRLYFLRFEELVNKSWHPARSVPIDMQAIKAHREKHKKKRPKKAEPGDSSSGQQQSGGPGLPQP